MQIIKYKFYFLIFSLLILIPGTIALFVYGLKLSIDFTGGSLIRYQFANEVSRDDLQNIFSEKSVEVETINTEPDNTYVVRTKPIDPTKNEEIKIAITEKFEGANLRSFETVGPVIGKETTKNAFVSLGWASVGILLYIAYAFRNIPKPYSSFRFGASAIIAMLHDALLVVGIFAFLGHFFNTEVDSLFITAILTVIGFSVHDTIVVFDRIRENLSKLPKSMNFEDVVNFSIVETLNRSIATSLTVLVTLLSLYVLGGESIRTFVLAMLIGIASGTYSSIFTASPILVIWEKFAQTRAKKK
ncbi:protein translocase subunit SecF [candidate division WWE3 bacterium]|jgi:preprotein translocase subunit SecF|uniref:Protein-export membrane protein SecF n=1 Tax=candidate division WWE3 bacterium TaxID=2053526 RepID=A0A3A4ZGL3_UNCKA|nr:MAG: protein translocase subunit SecF [candidate division WWE3 bacterium]